MKKRTEVNFEQIKELFEKETGVNKTEIMEISDAFPYSKIVSVKTLDKNFYCLLTNFGKAKKKSFEQEF